MKTKLGRIVSYNHQDRAGWMRIEGEPFQVQFTLGAARNVVAGFSEPEFRAMRDVTDDHIEAGDEVVVSITANYKSVKTPECHTLIRVPEVSEWCCLMTWNMAWKMIRERPIYEVVEYILWDGKPTTTANQRTVIALGTAIQLQALSQRGSSDDRFAPLKEQLGFTYRRRFYIVSGLARRQVPDPRPYSNGFIPEPFEPTNEQGVILAKSTDLSRLEGADLVCRMG